MFGATSGGVDMLSVLVLDRESNTTVLVECGVSSGSVTLTAVGDSGCGCDGDANWFCGADCAAVDQWLCVGWYVVEGCRECLECAVCVACGHGRGWV